MYLSAMLVKFLFLQNGMSHQSYLLVKLELEGETDRSTEYLSQNITNALKVLFGETGAAIPFKVIKSCQESNSVIISCPDTYLVKLRAALTLQSSYQGMYNAALLTLRNNCITPNVFRCRLLLLCPKSGQGSDLFVRLNNLTSLSHGS